MTEIAAHLMSPAVRSIIPRGGEKRMAALKTDGTWSSDRMRSQSRLAWLRFSSAARNARLALRALANDLPILM